MRAIRTGADEIYAGLVGQAVDTFRGCTEADPLSIAAHFMVAFGNAVGSGPHFFVGETIHRMNEFLLVVGKSSRARKGDGKNTALRPFEIADPNWFTNCISSGLSSSEGLIYHVRDPVCKTDAGGNGTVADEGVSDKRILLVETEFAGVLKQFERTGNTLSPVLRDAWDSKRVLRTLVKNQPTKSTNPHVSLIGHTTVDDLHRYLTSVDAANGFGNRFLMIETDRICLLPTPKRAPADAIQRLACDTRVALQSARASGEMKFSSEAEELWEGIYPELTREQPGLVGSLLARSEAHVRRLSALFCLFCGSRVIDVPHLESALAFWDVCEASVLRIFAGRTGDSSADRIREAIRPGDEMKLTDIRQHIFSGHIKSSHLRDAVELLIRLDEFAIQKRDTGGRPAEVLRRRTAEEMMEEKLEKPEKGQMENFSGFSSDADS